MHPSRRVVERKTASADVARVLRATPQVDQMDVPLKELNESRPPSPHLDTGLADDAFDVEDTGSIPTRLQAAEIISGTGTANTFDPYYTPARVAQLFPDLVQGDISHLPIWATSVIRRSTSANSSSRYVYVEAFKDQANSGLYHVEALPGGRKVASVLRFNNRLIHDVVSVSPAEHEAAVHVFDSVAAFLSNPTEIMPSLGRAAQTQPTVAARKMKV